MTYIPGGGVGSIATSNDVALNNPVNNDALVYDSATEKWTNAGISLSDNSVTTAKIADDAVTNQKVQAIDMTKVTGLQNELNSRLSTVFTKRTITTNYTVTSADGNGIVLHVTSSTAITISFPHDSTQQISEESPIPWRVYGAGQVTFAPGGGASVHARGITSGIKSAGQYSEGVVTKVAPNTWVVSGDIIA